MSPHCEHCGDTMCAACLLDHVAGVAVTPIVGDWVQTWPGSPLYEVTAVDGEWAAVQDAATGRKMGVLLADLTVVAHEDAE